MPNITQITPPRVPIIDERTKLISREWYRFFLNLYTLTGSGLSDTSIPDLMVAPTQTDQSGNFTYVYDQSLLASLPARPVEIGNIASYNLSAIPFLGFVTTTTPYAIPVSAAVGTMYWDGGRTLNVRMTPYISAAQPGVVQPIGEAQYYYIKAEKAVGSPGPTVGITKGQLVMFTGSVGNLGILTGQPATGVTNGEYLMGIAAENIAANEQGLVINFGLVSGIDATGGTEAWTDGTILYYDPAVAGGLTKNIPTAPNVKAIIAAVVKSNANGSIFVRVSFGSKLGETDSNVQFSTLANGDLIQYNSSAGYWLNTPTSSIAIGLATNLSGGAKNQIPYQSTASVTVFMTAPTSSTYLNYNGSAFAWTTTIPIANGGTGANTATSAFNALSPATTKGDIIYNDGTNDVRLPIGTTGQLMQVVASAPSWITTVPIANGGTGANTATSAFGALAPTTTQGDMIYYTTNNTRLAIGTTNQIMQSTGSAPQWAATTGSGVVARATYPTFTSSIAVGGATPAAGQGITFVSTTTGANSSDVNTLDFYEEGTWTPTLTINNTTTGITYSTAVGRYTRVGNFIQAQAYFVLTDKGTTAGNVRITGFPFASANITNYNQGGNVAFYSNMTAINGGVVNGYIGPNARVMTLVTPTSALNNMANLSATQVTSSMAMVIGIGYTTNT